MRRKRKFKHKINTNGKSYKLIDSPFYKLSNKKRLLDLLKVSKDELKNLLKDEGNYAVFTQTTNGKSRVIEHPSDNLDKVHTKIASLLCRISTPNYVHSGVKGRSHVTNAKEHAVKKKVLTTDIKAFFPSTSRHHIYSFFRGTFKCSSDIADILSKLCTYDDHIPTGSRLSMPLALWANINMFEELHMLAKKHDINMTVYVDDITFSGDSINQLFRSVIKKVITRHGHVMHPKKTVIYNAEEVKVITGIIINEEALRIKNNQHKSIYQDIEQWKLFKNLAALPPESLNNRLLGRLNALSIIEPRLKDKARSIRLAS